MLMFLIFLIAVIVSVISAIYMAMDEWSSVVEGIFLAIVLTFIFVCILGLITTGIYYLICIAFPNYEIECYVPIASLGLNSQIEGRFTLGTGTIREKEYYYFFVIKGNNRYVRDKIPVEDVTIYETDLVTPRLQWTTVYNKVPKWVGTDLFPVKKNFILFVPKGTVIKRFSLE